MISAAVPLVVVTHLIVGGLVYAQSPVPAMLPAPPHALVDTSLPPTRGRSIAVSAGGDLQAALNAAQPGDVITLEPGAVFRGNFGLPNKRGAGWIVVRTAASDDKLPAAGTRVTPSFFLAMPKILSPNQNPAIYTQPGAHHFRFIGVEVGAVTNVKTIYAIVSFGAEQTSDAETPHDLILDRCYIHGHPALMSSRGVLLNSASSAVVDSHISEIHAVGYDSQAVLGYNGPGPFKIVNNFLEGAGENVMFGGADPRIRGLVPSDIEIRRNHFFKPASWNPADPTFAGVKWTVKNLLELKNAQRVLIEGNLLESNGGTALLLTPRNQNGTAPWSVVQDVLFRSNIVKNAAGGFAIQSSDNEAWSQPTKRIAVINNAWGGITDRFFLMTTGRSGPLEDFTVDHNTAIWGGYGAYYIEGGKTPPTIIRFRFTNNLVGNGRYGVNVPKVGDAQRKWFPDAVIAKNALINLADQSSVDPAMYTAFPNAAAAGLNADGTLTPTSPNRRAGTDGKDIGVDFEELLRAYAGQSPRK